MLCPFIKHQENCLKVKIKLILTNIKNTQNVNIPCQPFLIFTLVKKIYAVQCSVDIIPF